MKKFLVIGNPIEHSLSPKLHNYWINNNNLDALYGKLETYEKDLPELCKNIKDGNLDGLNVTVPLKKTIIPFIDILSGNALRTQSVNTVSINDGNLIGDNTDIDGFEQSIKNINYDVTDKTILVLGAGGVVPSIIYSLKRMNASKIVLSNRTREKAENLKKIFNNIKIIDWGNTLDFDVIINATSIGLNEEDRINLNFSDVENKFFYDVIYNPSETNFLKSGKKFNNKVLNGKMMFIYQASLAFKIWHGISPKINDNIMRILEND